MLWRDGHAIDLGVAPGYARWINERGDVAGDSMQTTSSPRTILAARVFRWRDGRLLFSTPLIGTEVAMAVFGLDEQGRMAGYFDDGSGDGGPNVVAWIAP